MRKVIEGRDTLLELADFFHTVAHQEGLTISRGMTIPELAQKAGTRAPRSLRGAVISSTAGKVSKARKGQPVLRVVYDEPRGGLGVAEFKKCINVGTTSSPVSGTVKACIDCSITKLQCTITLEVTGTIVIG